MGVNGLVPARFLTLVSHLIITIVIFMNLDENVTACLPLDHTSADYDFNTNLLMVGLILTLVFLGIEFVCFLSGISMFMPIQCLISTFAHAGASIALSYFIVDVWKCYNYYYVFAICSAFPVFTELVVVVGAMVFRV
ncbi:hypothetical protein NP493_283g04012 [Ridgeia piscesae]|uniref:Transmembrane protein 107 n=1 Tax=Ridgeia piscesae TaxID=27915 RepID=A0AAD9NX56_RIDPI|nr:hypothetical protein NP493_283g04012 [Ridgeia piscesae]